MDRTALLKLWDESWTDGIWIAPWSKALADLSPVQAAWRPAPERHSIWAIVSHVCAWREFTLTSLDGRPGPTRQDMDRMNFEVPDPPSTDAWMRTRSRLEQSHREIRAAITNAALSLERPTYHLGHDCYHLGQIMYLRALQGLKPIE